MRIRYRATRNPILSIDTKKKELLGDLFRAGRTYTTRTVETADHDFPSQATGTVFPHGIYDTERNCGHINLGVSHDTSRFAADSLESWWRAYGKPAYPNATSILLLCDGGGSNAASRYVFKSALETLVSRIGVEIRVAHYPPYCSKYNPIEHRMFPHVTKACQGIVFYSTEMVVRAMARTRTRTGLRTTVAVIEGEYPTGEKPRRSTRRRWESSSTTTCPSGTTVPSHPNREVNKLQFLNDPTTPGRPPSDTRRGCLARTMWPRSSCGWGSATPAGTCSGWCWR